MRSAPRGYERQYKTSSVTDDNIQSSDRAVHDSSCSVAGAHQQCSTVRRDKTFCVVTSALSSVQNTVKQVIKANQPLQPDCYDLTMRRGLSWELLSLPGQ